MHLSHHIARSLAGKLNYKNGKRRLASLSHDLSKASSPYFINIVVAKIRTKTPTQTLVMFYLIMSADILNVIFTVRHTKNEESIRRIK